MRVKCLHGYFIFHETKVGQVSDWMSLTGMRLVPKSDYFTFDDLQDAPSYSINGGPLLSTTAIKTFEGQPWEVFEANGMVYDFTTGEVRPIASTQVRTVVKNAGNRFVSPGLLLPGSLSTTGKRIKDFSGWFSRDRLRWLYSEVSYV